MYLEITGYYLTAAAWLAAGAASDAGRARRALARGESALDWLRSVTAEGAVPPTRLYLGGDPGDWRNSSVFTFDLAMAARGVACFAAGFRVRCHAGRRRPGRPRRRDLRSEGATALARAGGRASSSGALVDPARRVPPQGRSRAALPAGRRRRRHARRCLSGHRGALDGSSRDHRGERRVAPAPVRPRRAVALPSAEALDVAEAAYDRVLAAVEAEGRSDVLAQALRVGALLRASGRLCGDARRGASTSSPLRSSAMCARTAALRSPAVRTERTPGARCSRIRRSCSLQVTPRSSF